MTGRMQRRETRRIVWTTIAVACIAWGDGFADEYLRPETGIGATRQLVAQMTNITGTVTRVGDDIPGQRPAIGIVSEQRIYLVGDEGIGEDLGKLVGRTVTVSAMVKQDIDGWPYLSIEWYRVLEG